jgi:hypothetical protein
MSKLSTFAYLNDASTTSNPSASASDSDDMPIILGGVLGGVAVLLVCVIILTRDTSSGSAEPALTPEYQRAPVLTLSTYRP